RLRGGTRSSICRESRDSANRTHVRDHACVRGPGVKHYPKSRENIPHRAQDAERVYTVAGVRQDFIFVANQLTSGDVSPSRDYTYEHGRERMPVNYGA